MKLIELCISSLLLFLSVDWIMFCELVKIVEKAKLPTAGLLVLAVADWRRLALRL